MDKTNLSAFKTRSKIAHSPPNSGEASRTQQTNKIFQIIEEPMEVTKPLTQDQTLEEPIFEEGTVEDELFSCDLVLGARENEKSVFDILS